MIESLGKCHNVRCIDVLVLLRPGTTAQLIRLDHRENGKVQQGDLIGQDIGGYT